MKLEKALRENIHKYIRIDEIIKRGDDWLEYFEQEKYSWQLEEEVSVENNGADYYDLDLYFEG